MTQESEFAGLCGDYWDFLLETTPHLAHAVGDSRHDTEIARESLAEYELRYSKACEFLERLEDVDPSHFSRVERQSHVLLRRELENTIRSFEFDRHLRPQLFPFPPDAMIGEVLNQSAVLSVKDADNHVRRLRKVPQFLYDFMERLRLGSAKGYSVQSTLVERIAGSAQGQLDLPSEETTWFRALVSKTDDAFIPMRREACVVIETEINPALRSWLIFLRQEYAKSATHELALSAQPNGDEFYRFLVESETLSEMTPEEIHKKGLEEVLRIRVDMEDIATKAGYPGDLEGFRTSLFADNSMIAQSAEALREKFEILSKRIDRKIPEFFAHVPRTTYGIESIPKSASASLPPAYADASPANKMRSGIHWVTSLPERCPSFMHIPLSLHEGWPGHLMHIALLQEIEDIPAFRRHGFMNYNAYLEGWALYCERLGQDMGFYDTPAEHYGRLDMEMWRATRLVVDTGLHLMGWTRQQAIDYMVQHLAMPLATIEGEVDRYIGLPAQALAYKVGEFKMLELRTRAEDTLKDDFSLRELHDQLINCGPVTLTVLDEHIQDWLDAKLDARSTA